MRNKSILLGLALLTASAGAKAADYTGAVPEAGKTYYLYNVGTQQFLGQTDGTLTMAGERLAVTLAAAADGATGFYTLSTPGGPLGSALHQAPNCTPPLQGAATAYYTDWRIDAVSGEANVYTLSNRYREASACYSLYADDTRLTLEAAQPGDYPAGQWKLIDTSEYTGVDAPTLPPSTAPNDEDVFYNAAGVAFSPDQALPHGIYIVGGKKVVK